MPRAADQLHRAGARAGRDRGAAASSRLLTLTGAGGCGKTRLGFEAGGAEGRGLRRRGLAGGAGGARGARADGPAIAQALGTRLASDRAAEIALAGHIGDRRAAARARQLRAPGGGGAPPGRGAAPARCPDLRPGDEPRAARIAGEVDLAGPVALAAGAGRLPPPAIAAEAESVRLFVARAPAAAPGFRARRRECDRRSAQICRRLDGMPLAIELAAARMQRR